jgi:hypothetical protein
VRAAFFDHTEAAPACLEGTRIELLSTITTWMNDHSSQKVYWLSGAAGTGKTTVAQSVAQIAEQNGFLCLSFFFSRTANDRGDYGNVIPTIAYQLAKNERCRLGICAALDADSDIRSRAVHIQAQKLVLDVLTPLASDLSLKPLIILDALDECKEDANKAYGGNLVPVLLATLHNITFAKMLITSRRESSIERMFAHIDVVEFTRPLVLHRDIPRDTVQADIELYLRDEFAKIRHVIGFDEDFPSQADIHALVHRSDGLFICARTVVEYISDSDGSPNLRLTALLESEPSSTAEQYERLDGLYSLILRKALRFATGK